MHLCKTCHGNFRTAADGRLVEIIERQDIEATIRAIEVSLGDTVSKRIAREELARKEQAAHREAIKLMDAQAAELASRRSALKEKAERAKR